MKPQWTCAIENDGRILLRCLVIDENGINCPAEMKMLPSQAEHLGNALLRKAAEARRTR